MCIFYTCRNPVKLKEGKMQWKSLAVCCLMIFLSELISESWSLTVVKMYLWFFLTEVSVFHRQSPARVPRCHHVPHTHLRPLLLRLRAPSELLQEGGPEFHSHLWVHEEGCCLQSKALLSQGREAVLTVHWAFPLLQKVSRGPSLPSELLVCCSEGRVWPQSQMGCAAFWICWIPLRTSFTEVRGVKFTFNFLPVVSSPFAETLILCYGQSFIQEDKYCQVPVMSGQDDTACRGDSLGLLFVFICTTVIV